MISGVGGSAGYLSSMMAEMRRQQTKSTSELSEELFSKADVNGDGIVDESELSKALSSQSKVGSSEGPSAEELFDLFDADGDGGITEEEHADGMQALQDKLQGQQGNMAMMGMLGMMGMEPPQDGQQSASDLFSELDANDDGVIDAEELASALDNASSSSDDDDSSAVEELIAALDANGDGTITRQAHNAGLQAMREQQEPGNFAASLMASAIQQYQSVGQGTMGLQAMTQVSFFA